MDGAHSGCMGPARDEEDGLPRRRAGGPNGLKMGPGGGGGPRGGRFLLESEAGEFCTPIILVLTEAFSDPMLRFRFLNPQQRF